MGARAGLIEALGEEACVVVADDFPAFIVPRLLETTAQGLGVRLERVDGNGLYPFRHAGKAFTAAVHFRRHLQKTLPGLGFALPAAEPLHRLDLPALEAPPAAFARYPAASQGLLAAGLGGLGVDGSVGPCRPGGALAAEATLQRFLQHRLARYADRNHPDVEASSELSPYLHWGHLSAHEVFARATATVAWSPGRLAAKASGLREGWWGAGAEVEAFLDQLVTWRELGFNGCAYIDAYDQFESLPGWARATLEDHGGDPRPERYELDRLEAAETADPVWNAAQRELRASGLMHNYLRMLWGKRVLEWSRTPQEALAVLIHLNNKYALDGRDPNSYSGICWTFGRYDRPWFPERPIFGNVRYMSSAATLKKLKMKAYMATWGTP